MCTLEKRNLVTNHEIAVQLKALNPVLQVRVYIAFCIAVQGALDSHDGISNVAFLSEILDELSSSLERLGMLQYAIDLMREGIDKEFAS